MPDSPYKFLDYYGYEDTDIFFGRERETQILLSDVVVNRLVVLFAKTGTGKTSLINAGVRPRLEERDYATFFIRVKKDPVESARAELLAHPKKIALRGDTLAEQLENISRRLRRPVVLFFDQFEEFFIYTSKEQPERAKEFISAVAAVLRKTDSGVHVVFSMREEWFVEMIAFRDEVPTVFHSGSNLRLRWFDAGQAAAAIVEPARKYGVEVEEALVARLVEDLADDGGVEPAQLQIICDTLWRRREGERLTLRLYETLGRAEEAAAPPARRGEKHNPSRQILYRRLEEEFEKLPTEADLQLLHRLLPELRTDYRTKYVRDTTTLAKELQADPAALDELTRRLEESQLIRTDYRYDLKFIELSHDYLVEHLEDLRKRVRGIWPRRLLREAMSVYSAAGKFRPPADLVKISDNVEVLTIDAAQAAFLFRWALRGRANRYLRLWFEIASGKGVDVWAIVRESLHSKDLVEASYVIDLLGELGTPEAVGMLETVLSDEELAPYAVEVLSGVEELKAVELLDSSLHQEAISARAQVGLKRLSVSTAPAVASLAESALAAFEQYRAEQVRRAREETRHVFVPDVARAWEGAASSVKPPYTVIRARLGEGHIIPFLGQEASFGRPAEAAWRPGADFLPTGSELARYLAEYVGFPDDGSFDLAKVAQYFIAYAGRGPLLNMLKDVFNRDYAPSPVHRLLARTPVPLLIVTTNYDDLMERALREAGRPYEAVIYTADPDRGETLLWQSPGEGRWASVNPGELYDIDLERTAVVYKLYGSARAGGDAGVGEYVITEDDLVNLMVRINRRTAIPATFAEAFQTRSVLFLGFNLRDWGSRVLLNRLGRDLRLSTRLKSWAVQPHPTPLEQRFWQVRNVSVHDLSLDEFTSELEGIS